MTRLNERYSYVSMSTVLSMSRSAFRRTGDSNSVGTCRSMGTLYGINEEGFYPFFQEGLFNENFILSPRLDGQGPMLDSSSGVSTPRHSRRGQTTSTTAISVPQSPSSDIQEPRMMSPNQLQVPSVSITTAGHGSQATVPNAITQIQHQLARFEERMQFIEHYMYSCYNAAATNAVAVQPVMRASGRSSLRTRDLDNLLMPHFVQSPNSDTNKVNRILREIESSFPSIERRRLGSEVRKWYRKKRDENGQKIFAACEELIKPQIESGMNPEELKTAALDPSSALYQDLKKHTDLPFVVQAQLHDFLADKVGAYFRRRVEGKRN